MGSGACGSALAPGEQGPRRRLRAHAAACGERELIEAALARCMEASGLLLDGDMEAAMLKLHTKS